jgi:putative ABC transport system permease protein
VQRYLRLLLGDRFEEQELQQLGAKALTVVGFIALAINGIDITNITVASVIERTKKIGFCRAVGASRLQIMSQFILESAILSLVSGIISISTVQIITQTIALEIEQFPYNFSARNASLSLSTALLVGIGSSFFPALQATRINIVEALRND